MQMKTAAVTVLIAGAGLLAVALVSGTVYEQVQRGRDRQKFPQIGRSVDIGGRALNIYCSGEGGPAVILMSGATWPFYDNPRAMFENGTPRPGYAWTAIHRELSKVTTTCWYDRAGTGWSDLGPYPRDSASQARELHTLLLAAAIPPPYVLVGESSAALDARVYTGTYSEEVAGVVLVDGVHPDLFTTTGRGKRAFPAVVWHSQDLMAQAFNRVGLYRLGPQRPEPAPLGRLTTGEWHVIWHLAQSAQTRSAMIQEIAGWHRSTAQARRVTSFGDLPLTVVTSGNTGWMDLQRGLVRLSSRGRQLVVSDAAGDLIYCAPDAIIGAVREVLSSAKEK
jgi:pimeloyl-ACP methyl ester carboxylesterase